MQLLAKSVRTTHTYIPKSNSTTQGSSQVEDQSQEDKKKRRKKSNLLVLKKKSAEKEIPLQPSIEGISNIVEQLEEESNIKSYFEIQG